MRFCEVITELDKMYTPAKFGFINEAEIDFIKQTLTLDKCSEEECHNLRNAVVSYYGAKAEEMEQNGVIPVTDDIVAIMNKMSAITAVIDECIWNMGGVI